MTTSTDLVLADTQTTFTKQQLAVLKQVGILENVPANDIAIFFHQCKRTGLDPFAKQIYMIPRGGKQTIQTGIDGYRLIAERTGKYVGSDERVATVGGLLASATVTVKKAVAGFVGEFTATAKYSEYLQRDRDGKPQGLWAKMPERMLIKCAEALALRKAFPQDLFGIITSEEMGQADNPTLQALPVADADPLISDANKERFKDACVKAGLDWVEVRDLAEIDVDGWDGLRESGRVSLLEAFKLATARQKQKAAADVVETEYGYPSEPYAEIKSTVTMTTPPYPDETPAPAEVFVPITPKQLGMLKGLYRGKGFNADESHELETEHCKRAVGSTKDLSKREASGLIELLDQMPDEGVASDV